MQSELSYPKDECLSSPQSSITDPGIQKLLVRDTSEVLREKSEVYRTDIGLMSDSALTDADQFINASYPGLVIHVIQT